MKKISKIVAGVLLASMTMFLCACGMQKESKDVDGNILVGVLHFAQPVDKATELWKAEGYKPAYYFDDLNSMLLALRSKKIDCIADLPEPVAKYIFNRNQDMTAREPKDARWRGNVVCRMSVAKENTKTCELLNSAIKELKENGKLDELQKKYVDGYLQKGNEPKPIEMPKFDGAATLRVAVTGDYPPIDLTAADGTPAGFNVAVLAEIAKLKKINFVPISMNGGARFVSLKNNIVDVVFYTDKVTYNDVRETSLWNEIQIPVGINSSEVYAQYPIHYVLRK